MKYWYKHKIKQEIISIRLTRAKQYSNGKYTYDITELVIFI